MCLIKIIIVVGIDRTQEAIDLIDKGFMTGTVGHDPRALADALYTVRMNLTSSKNPLEGTNYKIEDNGIEGPLDFSLIGILASISTILAQKGISIFAISTYDTDYILVKNKDIDNAIDSLIKERYEVI